MKRALRRLYDCLLGRRPVPYIDPYPLLGPCNHPIALYGSCHRAYHEWYQRTHEDDEIVAALRERA